jgi:hypothetical protein
LEYKYIRINIDNRLRDFSALRPFGKTKRIFRAGFFYLGILPGLRGGGILDIFDSLLPEAGGRNSTEKNF